MKQCIECGAQRPDTAAYCGKCGRKQTGNSEQELRNKALTGDADAQCKLGMYCESKLDDSDLKEAASWFRMSANQGNVDAMLQLAILLSQNCTHFDEWRAAEAQAKMWLNRAAKLGSDDAATMLDDLYPAKGKK